MTYSNSARILVVEDQIVIVTELEETFREHGYDVVDACTNDGAIEKLKGAPFTLAILDVTLRGERATAVAAALYAQRVPVLIFTATEDIADMLEADPEAWVIRKPISTADLMKTVRRMVQRSRDGRDSLAGRVYFTHEESMASAASAD